MRNTSLISTVVFSVVILVIFLNPNTKITIGQERSTPEPQKTETPTVPDARPSVSLLPKPESPTSKLFQTSKFMEPEILILIHESRPSEMIVYDTEGRWIDGVREVWINTSLGSPQITGQYTMWKGPIKPPNTPSYKCTIREFKTIGSEEFYRTLQALNQQ